MKNVAWAMVASLAIGAGVLLTSSMMQDMERRAEAVRVCNVLRYKLGVHKAMGETPVVELVEAVRSCDA